MTQSQVKPSIPCLYMFGGGARRRLQYVRLAAAIDETNAKLRELTKLGKGATLEDVQKLNMDIIAASWALLYGLYEIHTPNLLKHFDELPMEKKMLHIAECLDSGIVITYPMESDDVR